MLTVVVNNKVEIKNYKLMGYENHRKLTNLYEFKNPAFIEAVKRGRRTIGMEETLKFWKAGENSLTFPRGAARAIIGFFRSNGIPYHVEDKRLSLEPVEFNFSADLREYQQEAVDAILKRDFGSLSAPTGAGKTVIGLKAVAERKQPALIITHSKELAAQWIDRIEQYLGIKKSESGFIGGGKFSVGNKITVALVQTLYKCTEKVFPFVGHIIIDESHHCPSRLFSEAVSAFDCKYMLGLSATPYRRDGMGRLMWWYLGDLVFEVNKSKLVEDGHVLNADVIIRKTEITHSEYDQTNEYSKFLSGVLQEPVRNQMICRDVVSEAQNGSCCIVLSDRISHCEVLLEMLTERGLKAGKLTGDMKKQDRADVMDSLRSGRLKCVIGTTSLLGEGLDIPSLDTAFLASPIKFSGKLIQSVGRILRPSEGKRKPRVYDYLDENFAVLKAQGKSRQKVYDGMAA